MNSFIKHTFTLLLFCISGHLHAQQTVKGRIIDALSKEPVAGVSIQCSDSSCTCSCQSGVTGAFTIQCRDCHTMTISAIGFTSQSVPVAMLNGTIELSPSASLLNAVVVTAGRGDRIRRAQAPVAISAISTKTIQETKPVSFDQLLNKVSGVNMVNLGNEQHQMSIRQPMSTKSLFLYLEDGIPVRTTGLFNHNALLEMNMAAVKNAEVIKGPSSSLYGSEAIGGVVNFITQAPTVRPFFKTSVQVQQNGYRRTDLQAAYMQKKWGFALSGYYAEKKGGFLAYSDFHKGTFTARIDYRFSEKTQLINSFSLLDYYSDMPSGVDSTMFRTRTFLNPQTFTYREVSSLRHRSTLHHQWNSQSKSSASIVLRRNAIGQNPNYRIKDDYRKTSSGWTGRKDLAHGEINESSFKSLAALLQHKQQFNWNGAALTAGASMDLSPSGYEAEYIRIKKDTITKKYTDYNRKDSLLTDYNTRISNYAAFAGFEMDLLPRLHLVASLRYDLFRYRFNNHLKPSAFSGTPDTLASFHRFSPKIGWTYSFNKKAGGYFNYSQGFVPPQVTEMFTGVQVPDLKPAVFYNYEIGGWAEVIKGKLSLDASLYILQGRHEILSVKLDDGSFENRNAGKTSHKGIELGLNATPFKDWSFRFSGALNEHRFVDFVEKGTSYNGNEMNGAPRWLHNTEVWYRPSFVPGLRIGAEWQKVDAYYMDARNTLKYEGYDLLNIRAAYQFKSLEIWLHLMNATDAYFSYASTKSASGHSYQLAEPRYVQAGLSLDFGHLFSKQP